MNTMTYKGYDGSVGFSREDGILFGRVLGVRDIIDYEGESVAELERDFHNAVDSYLSVCEDVGKQPDKPRSKQRVKKQDKNHRRNAEDLEDIRLVKERGDGPFIQIDINES